MNTHKCLRALVIFLIISGWVFSGWPRVWQNPPIPPEIQEARAASQGPNSPTSNNGSWQYGNDAISDGNGAAYVAYKSSTHTWWGFNFNIPAGSSIDGIEVTCDAWTGADGPDNAEISLSWDGGGSATEAKTQIWPTPSEGTISSGGATDTWGRTWSVSEINSSDFTVLVKSIAVLKAAANWNLDWIRITVYYTLPTPTTTLGDGTDPSNSTVAPSSTNSYLDQFTLVTNTGTSTVSALNVTTNSTGTLAISSMEIRSNDLVTQYFSTVSSPTGNNWYFSGGTSISVSTSSAAYRVRFNAKNHGDLSEGSNYGVTGTVTSFTANNATSGTDTDSATITVDNTAPANANWGTITPEDSQIQLEWTNPGDGDFNKVLILRKANSEITDAPTEGTEYNVNDVIGTTSTVIYVNSGTSTTDSGLINGTPYYYKIFAYDTYINYASGSSTGPHTPQVAEPTISCSTDISSTSFGPLTPASVFTSSPHASTTMSCSDTPSGCTLYVKDDGNGSSPGLWKDTLPTYLIPSPSGIATLEGGVEGYGIRATTTSLELAISFRYLQGGDTIGGLSLSNIILASSTNDISNAEVVVTHKAAISDTTFSGIYSDKITYSCLINY